MAYSMRHIAGILLVVVLIILLITSILRTDCACTGGGYCFCLQTGESLHTVREEDIRQIPEPAQSEYRNFLHAWETEYAMRTQEWASLYTEYHATERSEAELLEFDRQLARAYEEFLLLFRDRHAKFRERLNISTP